LTFRIIWVLNDSGIWIKFESVVMHKRIVTQFLQAEINIIEIFTSIVYFLFRFYLIKIQLVGLFLLSVAFTGPSWLTRPVGKKLDSKAKKNASKFTSILICKSKYQYSF
jgi:hypothetical protein